MEKYEFQYRDKSVAVEPFEIPDCQQFDANIKSNNFSNASYFTRVKLSIEAFRKNQTRSFGKTWVWTSRSKSWNWNTWSINFLIQWKIHRIFAWLSNYRFQTFVSELEGRNDNCNYRGKKVWILTKKSLGYTVCSRITLNYQDCHANVKIDNFSIGKFTAIKKFPVRTWRKDLNPVVFGKFELDNGDDSMLKTLFDF